MLSGQLSAYLKKKNKKLSMKLVWKILNLWFCVCVCMCNFVIQVTRFYFIFYFCGKLRVLFFHVKLKHFSCKINEFIFRVKLIDLFFRVKLKPLFVKNKCIYCFHCIFSCKINKFIILRVKLRHLFFRVKFLKNRVKLMNLFLVGVKWKQFL